MFAAAARAPLTAVASVVEMTGDYTLTLPVMLAGAIATALSRAPSYGTIYTTKLLRRGTDIDHPAAPAVPGPQAAPGQPPDPLRGYQILEITISAGSPASGQTLGDTTWPPGWIPVAILDNHTLRDPDPGITLTPVDRVNLLTREPRNPQPAHPHGQPVSNPDGYPQIRPQPHHRQLPHPAGSPPRGRTPARCRAAASTAPARPPRTARADTADTTAAAGQAGEAPAPGESLTHQAPDVSGRV